MAFPSLNACTVIFEEGKKAQMNHLQEMGGVGGVWLAWQMAECVGT